jgi:hypothetical protein
MFPGGHYPHGHFDSGHFPLVIKKLGQDRTTFYGAKPDEYLDDDDIMVIMSSFISVFGDK